MKNLMTLLIAVICFQFTNAQEFIKTKKYTITNKTNTKQQEEDITLFDVAVTKDNSIKVATLSILNIDFLEDIDISVLPKPNIENIEEVIKVTINYSTCCSHTETYYFMATEDKNYVSLPYLESLYCEGTVSETEYIFPVQTLGKENTILIATINSTETNTVKNVEILQSFVLNDDEFIDNDEIDYSEVLASY